MAKKILKSCLDFSADEFKDNPPNIIIDDASHILEHQLKMVEICYPQLHPGGMLIIEDVNDIMHTKSRFDSLGIPFKLYDRRFIKNRWDDVLIVYQK